jgi:DNA glycosylase AlkZ-like
MGWKERDWYLGEHGTVLFDRNGNAGPTVWWEGRIVGGWAQRPDGEIVYRLLEDVGSEAVASVEAEAERLAE